MKDTRSPLAGLNRVLLLVSLCGLLFAPLSKSFAEPEADPSDVLAAAKAWLGLIDTGQYEESYAAGSDVFRNSITLDKWMLALKTLRVPMGKVVSRKVTDHTYKPNGIRGLDAACVIINYDTSFAKGESVVETVLLKWENGKWLGLSYTWGPKPSEASDSDSESPSDTSTTTSTTTNIHVTPPPQSPPEQPKPTPQSPPELPLPE